MAILSTADFKTYTGLTGSTLDARLAVLIPAVQDMLERMAGRQFDAATYTEFQNGRGQPSVLVNNPPIRTLTSLQLVDEQGNVLQTYAATDYTINNGPDNLSAGLITLVPSLAAVELDPDYTAAYPTQYGDAPWFPYGERNVKVVYAGGFDTMPTALVLDMVGLVSAALSMTTYGVDPTKDSERLGDYSYSRGGSSGISALGVLGQSSQALQAAVYAVAQRWKCIR